MSNLEHTQITDDVIQKPTRHSLMVIVIDGRKKVKKQSHLYLRTRPSTETTVIVSWQPRSSVLFSYKMCILPDSKTSQKARVTHVINRRRRKGNIEALNIRKEQKCRRHKLSRESISRHHRYLYILEIRSDLFSFNILFS